MKHRIIFYILVWIPAISWSDAKIYHHNPYSIIRAKIGANCNNRISFEGRKIKQVVGDSQEYNLIHDNLGGHLFLLPRKPIGQKLHISLITDNNKVQEFELEVVEGLRAPIIVRFKDE